MSNRTTRDEILRALVELLPTRSKDDLFHGILLLRDQFGVQPTIHNDSFQFLSSNLTTDQLEQVLKLLTSRHQ
jgi:hypothetical protein